MNHRLFISCAKGLEYLLADELQVIGLKVTAVSPQGVYGDADLGLIYQLCLWSRLANRVQLILFSGDAYNEQSLYKLCAQFPWQTVFGADKTLAIEFHGSSPQLRNSMFGAQIIKDAIVDHFRKFKGIRPSVDRDKPQVLLHAFLKHDKVTVSYDLIGFSLHQRGYRLQKGKAPLKETLACAMLLRAQWPQLAANNSSLHDPFCGSGTLVIEAAMMAAHIAPGILRHDQALVHWVQHQPALWEKLRGQALQCVKPCAIMFRGTDKDPASIAMAKANAERAGVASLIDFTVLDINDCQADAPRGLLITNPPYGERLSDESLLIPIYQQLGKSMHAHYPGWQAAILTANPTLAKAIGLRASKRYALNNGALECKLYCFDLHANNRISKQESSVSEGAKMFGNRLRKNYVHLQKWATRNQIDCYRVYDADLPEYAYAIDIYLDYAVLQEYVAPASIPLQKAEKRSLEVLTMVPKILGINSSKLIVKQRKQQKSRAQYQKLNQKNQHLIVKEGKAKFVVNLYDYLDTGLFLDHRPLRRRFAKLASNTRFLNCFCYTASASVQAALAGSITTNVDLSKTYLLWAQENFHLNKLDITKHRFEQEDCLTWLKRSRERFDVIFLDPPSFSNSKRTTTTLDIQRDHPNLIAAAVRLLDPQGLLFFSTNLRRFKLAEEIQTKFKVLDISAETIDFDFKRNTRIHHSFMISVR